MKRQWRSVEPEAEASWQILVNCIFQNKVEPAKGITCPSCRNTQIHFFFARYDDSGKGGFWIWCRHCCRYEHISCRVPTWWPDKPLVPIEKLEHSPEWLDKNLESLLTA